MGKLYKAKEGGALVEAVSRGLVVRFTSQGGGFLQRLPRSQFDALYERVQAKDAFRWRAGEVTGDWLETGEKLRCYLNGKHWNGWVMPQFEFKEACHVVTKMGGRYLPRTEEFVVLEGTSEEERWVVEHLVVAGIDVRTWGIGSGSWCWEEAEVRS